MINSLTSSASKPSNCFVYGTLMATEVVQCLIGRNPSSIPGAILLNHVRHPVKNQVYPAVLPATGGTTENGTSETDQHTKGLLLLDLSPAEMKMLDYFEDEGVDYTRQRVEVHIPPISSIDNLNEIQQNLKLDKSPHLKNGYKVETNAYIWARGKDTIDSTKEWDYEAFRKDHLGWYLDSIVEPCRKEFEREQRLE